MLLFFFLATVLAATTAQAAGIEYPLITTKVDPLLRPQSGGVKGKASNGDWCPHWRYAVETHNIIDWKTIPQECELYVGSYLLGTDYLEDSKVVIAEALKFARSFNISNDGKDVWIFSIDEGALSNLLYYARRGFGAEPYDPEAFYEWIKKESAQPLPGTHKLYKALQFFGFKIVFLTGRREYKRRYTEDNLKIAGYRTWEKLILKPSDYNGTALDYKSEERLKLEEEGYRIVGNVGDQWSDLLGECPGIRSFKLPNPIYYVA